MSTMMKYEEKKLKIVGTRPIRPDGVDKVTGRARFAADYSLPGMLFGKVLRSPHAHARLVSIDTSAAEAPVRREWLVDVNWLVKRGAHVAQLQIVNMLLNIQTT